MREKNNFLTGFKLSPIVVVALSVCVLGGRPKLESDASVGSSAMHECARSVTPSDVRLNDVIKRHPEIFVSAVTRELRPY
jgi:hypothetical protein